MSVRAIWTVFCNGTLAKPGDPFCRAWIGQEDTIAAARAKARAAGWKTGQSGRAPDYCAAHRGDQKAGPACGLDGARMVRDGRSWVCAYDGQGSTAPVWPPGA